MKAANRPKRLFVPDVHYMFSILEQVNPLHRCHAGGKGRAIPHGNRTYPVLQRSRFSS